LNKDQAMGAVIFVASLLGIIVYGWLLFFSLWTMMVLKITFFIAVAAILAILCWIGWTMATTPPPKPIEPESTSTESKKE